MDKKIVITIAREYGSGGRTIGEMLANELGIHFYDKELAKLASEESGINEALFNTNDEKVKASKFMQLLRPHNSELITPDSDEFTSEDNLFNLQAKVIRQLAERESCVIMGRCADYVLEDYDNVLSVFVHAPHDFKMEQAGLKISLKGKELERFIEKTDRQRAGYYKYHTGREWTDARNYDLCLNSAKLGFDKCVEEIISYMKVRFGEF